MQIISDNLGIIVGIITILSIAILLMRKKGCAEGNVAYILKGDSAAQGKYDTEKAGGEAKMKMKDRLELSWQFLYDITDIVLGKFSTQDQEATLAIGKSLLENGGRYEHVIDYGIRHNLGRATGKGVSKSV